MTHTKRKIVGTAARRYGTFSYHEATRQGLPRWTLSRYKQQGLVQRVFPRMYFGGLALTVQAMRTLAVEGGPVGTFLTGAAAEDEWGLSQYGNDEVHIVVQSRQRPMPGVAITHSRTVHEEDTVMHNGRLTATVERMLVDIAPRRSFGQLLRLLREATFRQMLDCDRLMRTIERNRTRAGMRKLRRAVTKFYDDGDGGSDSRYEERFVRMLEARGITGIIQNPRIVIGGEIVRPDVFIEPLNLVCQVDPDWHESEPIAREDRIKIALFQVAGYDTITVPGDDLVRGVQQVVDRWTAL